MRHPFSIVRMIHDWVGLMLGTLASIIVWSYYISTTPPLKILETPENQIVATVGESFLLCRKVEYIRDVVITITRELVRESDNIVNTTGNFTKETANREIGVYTICRDIEMPDKLKTGIYSFKTSLTTKTLFWTNTFSIPDVNLRVRQKGEL